MDRTRIKYPIYIVSKGRAKRSLTANFLKKAGVPFTIAVEPQEYDEYVEHVGVQYIAKLPFSNLGLGSYPARNWCWEDSISRGAKKHFLFDDNISGFCRLNNGKRTTCEPIEPLICLQDFVERYENVGISGYNYRYFVCRETRNPFRLNTHVYSGMLINNDVPFRWRLKYNEDVDLCLQILNTGKYCSILFNAFLINKTSTASKMPGGNQDELYQNNDEGKKLLKSASLQQMWPQYVEIVRRYNRPHHHVSWTKHFNQPLIKRTQPNG